MKLRVIEEINMLGHKKYRVQYRLFLVFWCNISDCWYSSLIEAIEIMERYNKESLNRVIRSRKVVAKV